MLKKEIPTRSHTGNFRKTNASNKKYLAVDFAHRCAYCDDLDAISGGFKSYHVEHFAPKEKFPDLKYTYDNLLYSCPFCNCSKNDDWVSSDSSISVIGDAGYVSPCEAEYQTHLNRDTHSGKIVPTSELGKYMFQHLNLGLIRHSLIYMVDTLHEKRKNLVDSIKEDRLQCKDVSKKERLLAAIDNEFFEYYFKLQQEQST